MNLRPLLVIPPILLALFVFTRMTQEDAAEEVVAEEPRLAVRVTDVRPHALPATVTGYGRVEAVRDWSAVAEVQGRLLRMPGELAVGSFVEAGTLLAEIDPTDYELARRKAAANIASVEAQLRELDRQEQNSRASLAVEQRIRAVAQAEFDRIESLVGRGASTQAALDTAQKTLLAQTTAVTALENALALYPAQRNSLEATLAVREAELAEAERAIEKATLTAPFRGRVAAMNVETGQFVRTGDVLLTLEDTSAVEITAEIQPGPFGAFVALALGEEFTADTVIDVSQAVEILNGAGITAEVGMSIAGMEARWPAEIVRLRGSMDRETGTLGLVVRVQDPLVSRRQINRPPLNVGSFVRVRFASPPLEGLMTVPRGALHYTDTGRPFVYLVDASGRLAMAEVETGQVIDDAVVVLGGLDGSETVVVSDPSPPVLGMALDPVPEAPPETAVR